MTDPAPAIVAKPQTLIKIAFAKSLSMSFLNDESLYESFFSRLYMRDS